jgi:hypothetical protein
MATLISRATGNMTTGSVFGTADAASLNLVRFNQTTTIAAAATATSTAFTVTNGAVIDGVLLWVKQGTSTAPTGTFKVDLQKSGVSQASVTVNKTDLPLAPNASSLLHPAFFRFTGTTTGDGTAN